MLIETSCKCYILHGGFMQDNTKRANRVLFWIKVIFIFFAVFWLQLIFAMLSVFLLTEDLLGMFGGIFIVPIVFSFFSIICVPIFFLFIFAFCVSYLSWLHRAITNLRLLTTTKFSPMGAVLLTCIPFVGYFLNYFIFSDMVRVQENYMQQHGMLKERFPKRMLNAWFIASLLLMVIVYVDPSQLGFLTVVSTTFDFDGKHAFEFLEKTLIVIIPILYIMSFSAFTKQESELFRIHTEELFNKHVDDVIRERKIMRAADMLRESENPKVAQAEDSEPEQQR